MKTTSRYIRFMRTLFPFMAVIGLALMVGCSDENNLAPQPVPDTEYGEGRTIELKIDMSKRVAEGDISFHLISASGERISLVAEHIVEDGHSVLRFEERLRLGDYTLTSITFKNPDGVFKEFNVGCNLNVASRGNTLTPDTYDQEIGLFGLGTEESPYLIARPHGLETIRERVNEGVSFENKYFRQVADIDMTAYYNKGFRSIAINPSYPFKGNYDGNGKEIQYCAIRRIMEHGESVDAGTAASGLFAYVSGASFKNVTMVNPDVMGGPLTGALIGGVLGVVGEESTPTLVENCQVKKTISKAAEVYGSNFVGGLVGGVDVYASLIMKNCENVNLPVGNSPGGAFVGGLVGGGVYDSNIIIDNCVNRAAVGYTDATRCLGGIVGGAATLALTNSENYGDIGWGAGYSKYNSVNGVGGIAGGLGNSTLAAVVNHGAVKAATAGGGLVGSTLIRKEDGTYSDVVIASGHNYGAVEAGKKAGGIVGEAQAMLLSCYNKGMVYSSNGEAGGLMSFGPAAVIQDCYNNASVSGGITGGLIGACHFYILTASANLGMVHSDNDLAGGIMALGGTRGMINYCTNYAPVTSLGDDAAGILTIAGEKDRLTFLDAASITVAVVKAGLGVYKWGKGAEQAMSGFKCQFKRATKVVSCFKGFYDIVSLCVTPPVYDDLDYWDSLYNNDINYSSTAMTEEMYADVRRSLPTTCSSPLAGSDAWPGLIWQNMQDLNATLDARGDEDVYSEAINDRLEKINKQVAKIEHAREIALAVADGILAVAGLAGTFVTGGASVAAAVAVLSAAVTIGAEATEREENCIEVSQCVNFGTVSGAERGAGLITRVGDFVEFKDCMSIGQSSDWAVSDVVCNSLKKVDAERIISVGEENRHFAGSGTNGFQGHFALLNKETYPSNFSFSYANWIPAEDFSDKSIYKDKGFEYDFDEEKIWAFIVPECPMPNNSHYYSFRE